MNVPAFERLSAEEKQALLGGLRQRPKVSEAPAKPTGSIRTSGSFGSLPAMMELKTQRAMGTMLGLANPFYREHGEKAGAWSRIADQEVANFASYDYLGLNGHPDITEQVAKSLELWGTSVSASRITAGERPFHRALESALADVYGAEDAVTFVSGHAGAVSTIAALMGPKDLVVYDSLSHNCVVVGAQLSGAARRSFPHNDLNALDELLASSRDNHERVLIVVEGLYSMDGDGPQLAELVALKEKWGAWLMVDDAHSLGVLGDKGLGIFEEQGVDPRSVDIWLGTLSKTLVSCGGYVAGSGDLIDFLKFTAPGLVYSVGMPASNAIAALTALGLMRREPERVARLRARGKRFRDTARAAGLDTGLSWGLAVTPLIIGDSLKTVLLAEKLLQRGYNAVPIIPPGVPERSARLRFFISSEHTTDQIDGAVAAAAEELDLLNRSGSTVADALRAIGG